MSRPLDSDLPFWDTSRKSDSHCAPPYVPDLFRKPLPRTIPRDDIPVRTLRDPRRRPPTLQEQIIQRRNSRAAAAANYGTSVDAPLTDREKSESGGCLMFLLCVAAILGFYISGASVSVDVHKKLPPKTIHKE